MLVYIYIYVNRGRHLNLHYPQNKNCKLHLPRKVILLNRRLDTVTFSKIEFIVR